MQEGTAPEETVSELWIAGSMTVEATIQMVFKVKRRQTMWRREGMVCP